MSNEMPLASDDRFSVVEFDRHGTLRAWLDPLAGTTDTVEYFDPAGRPYDRREADGFVTLRVTGPRGAFGVVCNDFKSKGGSFSKDNSERVAAFIDEAAAAGYPLVLIVDSMGVRLMDGRAVVKPAFGIIPGLWRFRERHLLVTCNAGHALGLGAVLCAAGHYRMAVAGVSLVNLAGPEIVRMFFGAGADFDTIAAADRTLPGSTMVSHLAASREDMLAKARVLVNLAVASPTPGGPSPPFPPFPDIPAGRKAGAMLDPILASLSDDRTEVFGCLSPAVRAYVATRRGRRFGLLINPPGNPDNLITAHALDKYILALDLYRVMRLPVVSLLDTPGGDPRDTADVIVKLWLACERIVGYPHGLMGLCIGRGYGGAIALGFPRFLGSRAAYVLEGASVGLMHPHLIDSLLASSKTLATQWNAAKAAQTRDCADIVEAGIIDGVIAPRDVPEALDRFLRDTAG